MDISRKEKVLEELEVLQEYLPLEDLLLLLHPLRFLLLPLRLLSLVQFHSFMNSLPPETD